MSIETWLSASRARLESPPLVRERQVLQFRSLFSVGITPAHVGKTSPKPRIRISAGDHPRSCGKDRGQHLTGWPISGSPPLVRERHSDAVPVTQYLGITPARAGKTPPEPGYPDRRQDHPRSCGKDCDSSLDATTVTGSPPLVRERPERLNNRESRIGITPARAGKTQHVLQLVFAKRDHPRSCGKDAFSALFAAVGVGSPPLVRERLLQRDAFLFRRGITPARAGKTPSIAIACFLG